MSSCLGLTLCLQVKHHIHAKWHCHKFTQQGQRKGTLFQLQNSWCTYWLDAQRWSLNLACCSSVYNLTPPSACCSALCCPSTVGWGQTHQLLHTPEFVKGDSEGLETEGGGIEGQQAFLSFLVARTCLEMVSPRGISSLRIQCDYVSNTKPSFMWPLIFKNVFLINFVEVGEINIDGRNIDRFLPIWTLTGNRTGAT